MIEEFLILFFALILDFIYPFHKGILLKLHPVYTSFKLAFKLYKPYASKIYGVLIWFVVIFSHILLYYLIYILIMNNKILSIIYLGIILKLSISARLLIKTLNEIYKSFKEGNIERARFLTQGIVRRNVYKLDDKHVISAAIESCAESLNDGFISPTFYYTFLGPFGALFQRLVNTLDSALGYKYERIKDVGWFSAKMDTIINYIPARLTSMYIILASMLLGYNWKNSIGILLRDRNKTQSKNAGYPISAISGALGIRLEKPGHYSIGENLKNIEYEDILRARNVAIVSMILHIFFIISFSFFVKFLSDKLW